jgi:hypothetical protein
MYLSNRKGKLTIILLYVDDLPIIGEDREMVNRIKLEFMMTFEMIDLGEVEIYLKAKILRTKQGVWMHQRCYM